jgi:hypothetical protein
MPKENHFHLIPVLIGAIHRSMALAGGYRKGGFKGD